MTRLNNRELGQVNATTETAAAVAVTAVTVVRRQRYSGRRINNTLVRVYFMEALDTLIESIVLI